MQASLAPVGTMRAEAFTSTRGLTRQLPNPVSQLTAQGFSGPGGERADAPPTKEPRLFPFFARPGLQLLQMQLVLKTQLKEHLSGFHSYSLAACLRGSTGT